MRKFLLNLMPETNWTALGSDELISPRQHQVVTTGAIQARQLSSTENLLATCAAKNEIFGKVNNELGPVEKAVLQQAAYNQSKSLSPEMRRCGNCNVTFNSQTQAEMHYKGKKHAKIMHLKRSRETNVTLQKLKTATYLWDEKSFANLDTSQAQQYDSEQTSSTNETENQTDSGISGNFPLHSSDNIKALQTYADNSAAKREGENRQSFPNGLDILPKAVDFSLLSMPSDLNENQIIQIARNDEDSNSLLSLPSAEDDKSKRNPGTPHREAVVLPDPLPRYISRTEKPSILKEALRCTVCDTYVNSENQMRQHVNSLRHKNIEKGIPTPPKPIKEDRPKGKTEQFRCEVCRVTLNSDIQLLQHLSSQRHRNMLEGKPPKPKWSPYQRTQHALLRSSSQLGLSLKTIAGGSSPLLLASSVSNPAGLAVAGHTMLRPAALVPQAPTHLKQMAYLAPNGGVFQTQEIVYIESPGSAFSQMHQLPAQAQLLPAPFPGVNLELNCAITRSCVSLSPRTFNWNS